MLIDTQSIWSKKASDMSDRELNAVINYLDNERKALERKLAHQLQNEAPKKRCKKAA